MGIMQKGKRVRNTISGETGTVTGNHWTDSVTGRLVEVKWDSGTPAITAVNPNVLEEV